MRDALTLRLLLLTEAPKSSPRSCPPAPALARGIRGVQESHKVSKGRLVALPAAGSETSAWSTQLQIELPRARVCVCVCVCVCVHVGVCVQVCVRSLGMCKKTLHPAISSRPVQNETIFIKYT